jgi:hypothetical protein
MVTFSLRDGSARERTMKCAFSRERLVAR